MQTSFYASGFLYNLKNHKILLIQSPNKDDAASLYSMLGGESKDGEEALATFQRVIFKILNINLKVKHIYPIYDYFHNTRNKINYVFYAEVGQTNAQSVAKGPLSWFSFHETLKLSFTTQTKQDIVVGERVINAKWRENQGVE